MTLPDLLALFKQAPLVASSQASDGSPLADPETLRMLADSSLMAGVKVLRLQGVEAIRHIHGKTKAPVIALIKRHYDDSPVYITPTMAEVDALLSTDAEAIGLDATQRRRPGGASLQELLAKVHQNGRLAMADCDTLESAIEAERMGFDFVGTTLAGYTENRPMSNGPDLELLRSMVQNLKIPVIAEGRYSESWQVQAAMRIGASAVVMGAALNDTPTLTKRYFQAATTPMGEVGAFDIGGTWLRFGRFSEEGDLLERVKVALSADPSDRLEWMRGQIQSSRVARVGVGTGGVVDPKTGIVTHAKPIIPNHVGSEFSERTLGVPTFALNDGLATAWGHACRPEFAGKRVATLAIGTGVGFGIVDRGRILMGPGGEPPHVNDLSCREGRTIEELLGGAGLGPTIEEAEKSRAEEAAMQAIEMVQSMFHPDEILICGGVGLADWLQLDVLRSPYGEGAGLHGAAALALWPPSP
ncbi:MAG TPA: putative N-acetylmannosamine-6-phosphate 2-epimerase [Fimbriimonadaceae bacterium]|nr:putative N-acetylmannosamine-6-phosphate 2-epimerase [Fimbriimonadaceae bacterium]